LRDVVFAAVRSLSISSAVRYSRVRLVRVLVLTLLYYGIYILCFSQPDGMPPTLSKTGVLKNLLPVFMCRQVFWEQACEIDDRPSVISCIRKRFKLGKADPHSPFFSRRIDREPDALFARHVGRPRQAHLAGVI
jgi:hypothetical protein